MYLLTKCHNKVVLPTANKEVLFYEKLTLKGFKFSEFKSKPHKPPNESQVFYTHQQFPIHTSKFIFCTIALCLPYKVLTTVWVFIM